MSKQPHHQVGAHTSIAGGHHKALEQGADLGCEVVQIFTKNNMQWMAPPLSAKALDAFHEAREQCGIKRVFGHSGYLINLAANNEDNLRKSRESLLLELNRSTELGLPFLVLHPGAHMGEGEEAGLARIQESLQWIFTRYDGETRIALEVTAGQGSCLGARIEHIAALLDGSDAPERLSVCLDTCHLFAAGFNISTKDGLSGFIAHFTSLIPWEKIDCVHINDSKGALGSRLDRHELLGQGKIGWECFDAILHHPAFAHLPLCLETPKGKDNINDRETLAELKRRRES